jgi:phage-related minor tail protein
MARGTGTVVVSIIGKADKLKSTLDESSKELDGFAGKMSGFGKSAISLGGKMTLGLTAPIAALGGVAINAASDMAESLSKVGVVFGGNAKDIEKWSKGAAKNLGVAQQDALEMAGTLGNLFGALGLSADASVDMSKEVVQLAADLGSFNNLPTADVLEKLRAGLVGEAEPLRALGVNINAATVEAKAMEMGLAATTKELTDSDKVQARYALILEQTTKAQGDFSRTADGLANSTKTAKAEAEDAAATLGESLQPIMQRVTEIAATLAEKFANLSPKMQTALLIVGGLAMAIGPLTTIIGGLSVALGFLAANPIVLVIAAVAALAAGLVYAYKTSETFRDIVNRVVQAVTNAFMDMAGWVLDTVDKMLGGFASMAEAASHLPFVGGKFKGVAEDIRGVQHTVRDMANTMHEGINIVSADLERARTGFRDLGLAAANIGFGGGGGGIIVGAGPVRARASGGPVTGGRPYLVGEQGPELFMPGRSGTILPNGAGGGATVVNVYGNLIGTDDASLARYLSDIQARARARGAI